MNDNAICFSCPHMNTRGTGANLSIAGCIQKFPDWSPGARTANGYSSLSLSAVVSIFYE
jgi:hypothetical protein